MKPSPLVACVVSVLAAGAVRAQDPAQGWFPFAIPVLADRAPAFDLRPLNEPTAGANGWLRAEGERFIDERGDTVRLFGTNLTNKTYILGGLALASALGFESAFYGEPRMYGASLKARF